jgi:ABC-type spermidine/putrescine transport system permease subunit I
VTTEIAGSSSPASQTRRRPIGLLLVAIPVLLVAWLIIWPIISAVVTTLWVATPEGAQFSTDTYRFFFSDGYSLSNLRFSDSNVAGYVQGLAIFPMFVPSIILSFAFIRVLGPNGTVDLLLNAVGLPKIRSPYLTPWGPVIGLVWDNIPLTVLILLSGLGNVSNHAIEAARDVGAGKLQVLWHIILPRIGNSVLVAISFAVLGIFSSFTLPYVLGPAAPEMMGPFMQRTFRDLFDPRNAITQAVITFGFCIVFGLFYVRSVAKNRTP